MPTCPAPADPKVQLAGVCNEYSFSEPTATMTLKGISKPDSVEESETLGCFSITLSKDEEKDWYWDDGRYNNSDYCVDQLDFTANGVCYPAFRIHPHKTKHTDFLLTKNYPIFKFSEETPHKVYKFSGLTTYECVAELECPQGWTTIPKVEIQEINKPVTIIIVPAEVELDILKWE